ncbi:unnamed protein product [Adineta steineri]|uniref:G-protein coupled receptors family 1 profile domain-containing protein n=1 Tax=Adineta steineri TaxID=433720 RepID=A0A818MES4_9BILA|nr:unnamed protein product [Adineta steineri]CAF3581313.1 unnamed protein product [Adineta steineri]
MLSCSNYSNASCLNGGTCVSDKCVCPNECLVGDRCEILYNAIDLPFSTAMLEDTVVARIVYIILITLLVIIGLINTIAGFVTFTRESIRITACGIYLIVFCSSTIIRTIFLQTVVLTIAAYDTPSLRLWSCYAYPYISLTMGFTGIWVSVGIAIERVLIECFNMGLYGTRRHAILVSIGFFIYAAISNLPAIFAREYNVSPSGESICIYDYISHPIWYKVDTIFSYIHVIIPCSVHLICSVCILTTIARRKILIHINTKPKQRLYLVWLQQLYIHRDFLVPPIFLITCLLPNAIHGHLLVKCAPYSNLVQLRLHIVVIFLLHIPSVFVYIVYIYPNESYIKELRQTWFYRIFCCCFYRKYKKQLQHRSQLTIKSTI